MATEIRPASAEDFEAWLPLWQGYLAFYESDLPRERTDLTWSRILDPAFPINCLVAQDGKAIVGFATFVTHPSTWLEVGDCYLEDLFVAPDRRGGGTGRALIDAVAHAARQLGCERLYWTTQSGNDRARALYDAIAGPSDIVRYRLDLTRQG